MTSSVNTSDVERWASAIGGAALTALGIKQLTDRSPAGAALAAAGGALMYRGATGHCAVYAAAGINTADDADGTRAALAGPRGVQVEEVVTISAPADQLYRFWRNLEQLPRFVTTGPDTLRERVSTRPANDRDTAWIFDTAPHPRTSLSTPL